MGAAPALHPPQWWEADRYRESWTPILQELPAPHQPRPEPPRGHTCWGSPDKWPQGALRYEFTSQVLPVMPRADDISLFSRGKNFPYASPLVFSQRSTRQMQRVPNGDSKLQQKAFVFSFFLGGGIKGEERFILEGKKKLFLALCRLSLVGGKVQQSPVPEPSTRFWAGFLPQQSLSQISNSAWHPPGSALAGATVSSGCCWSQERHFQPAAWDPRVPTPLLGLPKQGWSPPAHTRPNVWMCVRV